jgi:RNA polymerase sigma-70 factor, ECF subfamily
MDDLSLVKDILQGNADSFNVLIYRYEYHIYNFIYKNINNLEAARDVTQEVFIAVYNKLYTYKGEYKFSTWLFKIARNKCVDYARKHKRYIEVDLESAGDMVSREISPEQYIELSETKRALKSFIGELDDTDRQILILRYLNDKITFNDISDILGINLSTVKTKYYRMLERLKSQLSEETGRCRR